jgi:hypothetical protein
MKYLPLFIFLSIFCLSCSNTDKLRNRNGELVTVNCQPVYGNWCGKGYPAYEVTGIIPSPVDPWDEACMNHDLCYDEYGEANEDMCDKIFSEELERLDSYGMPAPHQIVNAYNYFKDNKPYRNINITFKDLWDTNTLSCDGTEGLPTLFCDVGMGRDNCEISMGFEMEGADCFCDYPRGYNPPMRLYGIQKPAHRF